MPTLNLQVAAGNADAEEQNDGVGFTSVSAEIELLAHPTLAHTGGFLFPAAGLPQGSTIDSATLLIWPKNTSQDDPAVDIYAEDEDEIQNFDDEADIVDRTKTTAFVTWDATGIGAGEHKPSPEIKTVIQEVSDRAGFSNLAGIGIICKARTDQTSGFKAITYETASAKATKLDITYTVPVVPSGARSRAIRSSAFSPTRRVAYSAGKLP